MKNFLILFMLFPVMCLAQIGIKSEENTLTVFIDTVSTKVPTNNIKIKVYSLEGKALDNNTITLTDTISSTKIFKTYTNFKSQGIYIINVYVDDKLFKKLYIHE